MRSCKKTNLSIKYGTLYYIILKDVKKENMKNSKQRKGNMVDDDIDNNINNEIDDDSKVIDDAFRKEIGISLYSAARYLDKNVITIECIQNITNICKNVIATEIERRNIPPEERFLLLNVIICTMFKTSSAFHRAYVKAAKDVIEEKEKQSSFIELIKEKCSNHGK
jgi:hypothetical protein